MTAAPSLPPAIVHSSGPGKICHLHTFPPPFIPIPQHTQQTEQHPPPKTLMPTTPVHKHKQGSTEESSWLACLLYAALSSSSDTAPPPSPAVMPSTRHASASLMLSGLRASSARHSSSRACRATQTHMTCRPICQWRGNRQQRAEQWHKLRKRAQL